MLHWNEAGNLIPAATGSSLGLVQWGVDQRDHLNLPESTVPSGVKAITQHKHFNCFVHNDPHKLWRLKLKTKPLRGA